MQQKLIVCVTLLLFIAMTGASGLLGGYKEADTNKNDGQVDQAARFAVDQLNSQQNLSDNQKLQLVKVHSVQKQVVAGLNYKLVLEVADASKKAQQYEVVVYQPLGDAPLQLSEHKQLS